MKLSGKKLRLKIGLRLYKNSRMIVGCTKQKISSITPVIRTHDFDRSYLKVDYGKNLVNEGSFFSKDETTNALRAFTEWALIKDIEQWRKH